MDSNLNNDLNNDLNIEEDVNVRRWQEYQNLIKEEITLNDIINKHQQSSIKSLKKNFIDYYRSKLTIKETCDFNSRLLGISHTPNSYNTVLIENTEKELVEIFDPVSKFLFGFRNNEKLILNLIESVTKSEEIDDLVNLLCHFFFENILIQNPENEELLYICYLLLEKEIERLNTPSVASFLDRSFIGRFLKSLTRRQDIKSYLSMILGDLILKMETSTENYLEINPSRIYDHIKSKKMTETVNKSFNLEKTKKIFEMDRKLMLGDRVRKTTIRKQITNQNICSSNSNKKNIDESIIVNKNTNNSSNSLSFNQSNISISVNYSENDLINFDEIMLESTDEDMNSDYLIDLTEDELLFRFEKEESPEMKEFYFRQLQKIDNDKNIFTNTKFLEHLSVYSTESYKVLFIYKKNFEKIKFFIDKLFTNLIENDSIIPYIIKCICKMIDVLITRKFPNIGFHEKNSFIGEFLFGKLIMPILTNPDYNGIYSSSVISINTRKNLCNINQILKKIYRANFFDSTGEMNFTNFNTYLIEIMPIIINLNKKILEVKLPKRVEDLIKSKLYPSDETPKTVFNYFTGNNDQLVNLQSICFSIQDLQIIYKAVKNNINFFSDDKLIKKTVEKIEYGEHHLLNILKESLTQNTKKYLIIFNSNNNPSKEELLYPKILKFTLAHSSNIFDHEFTLTRVKYCIKILLRSLNILNSTVYSHLGECDTSEKFFLALNKIIVLEDYSDNLTNDKIPLSWYSLYLNSNLGYLNEDFISDNYKKLYDELMNEAKKEIDLLIYKSNLIITKYGMNCRCAEKITEVVRKDVYKVKQIEKFIRVEKFIETGKISVCVRSKSIKDSYSGNYINNDDSPSIIISKPDQCVHRFHYLDKVVEGKAEKKNIINTNSNNNYNSNNNNNNNNNKAETKPEGHCESINEFINVFQNMKEIKEDIIFGDQRNKVWASIDVFLSILKEHMSKHSLFADIYNEESILSAIDDIDNYVLEKIYRKVFPVKESDKDRQFYDQCCKLEWVTPTHLEINKKYINESLWQSVITNLNRMDYEKSPVNKLKCVQAAYKIINNCINFSSGKDEGAGVDDIIPIIIYVIIQSKPKRIFSNMHYIKTFMNPGKLMATYGFLLTQIEMATEFIFGISYSVLTITEEEFNRLIIFIILGLLISIVLQERDRILDFRKVNN